MQSLSKDEIYKKKTCTSTVLEERWSKKKVCKSFTGNQTFIAILTFFIIIIFGLLSLFRNGVAFYLKKDDQYFIE